MAMTGRVERAGLGGSAHGRCRRRNEGRWGVKRAVRLGVGRVGRVGVQMGGCGVVPRGHSGAVRYQGGFVRRATRPAPARRARVA